MSSPLDDVMDKQSELAQAYQKWERALDRVKVTSGELFVFTARRDRARYPDTLDTLLVRLNEALSDLDEQKREVGRVVKKLGLGKRRTRYIV